VNKKATKYPVTPLSAALREGEAVKHNAHRVSGKSKLLGI
jgi:hypothetical protein